MTRRAHQIDRIEAALGRVETAPDGTEEILAKIGALGDQVAALAEAVREVMSARAQLDNGVAADAKAARTAAESAFVATQALSSVATAKPGAAELAAAVRENTEAVQQVHAMVTAAAQPPVPDPGPAAAKPQGM